MASLILRVRLRSRVRKLWRASCWVTVEPPWAKRPLLQVDEHRPHDADDVDAAMRVEALVLDREHRVDEVRRHLRQRHLDALFLEDREDRPIGDVVEHGRLGHVAHAADLAAARQGVGDVVGEPGDGHDRSHATGTAAINAARVRRGRARAPSRTRSAARRPSSRVRCDVRFTNGGSGEAEAHRRVVTIIRGEAADRRAEKRAPAQPDGRAAREGRRPQTLQRSDLAAGDRRVRRAPARP